MKKVKSAMLYIFVFTFLSMLISCKSDNLHSITVDFNSPSADSSSISFHQDEAIHVAIAAMSSPRESFMYYNELFQYISGLIGIPIHYIQKESYQEVNKLLEDKAVDFAFICSGAYINAKEKGIVDLLVAPVVNRKADYQAYIICNNSIRLANSIFDLEDKDFAFSDPLSHTGFYYPSYLLKQKGLDPSTYFNKVIFTYGHDLSIQMVNRGVVDAAAVNGLIYDYLAEFSPHKIINTRIIESSEGFGMPPIVIPNNLDENRKLLYRNIFKNLHLDPHGKEILTRLNIDRYEVVDDNIYNGIRLIKEALENEKL